MTDAATGAGLRLTRVRQVAQHVRDLERAVEFYRDVLGATHQASFGPLAFFDFEGLRLMLSSEGEADPAPGAGSPLYFAVGNIEQARATLGARGVAFESEPHLIFRDDGGHFGAAGTETWMAFFRDPDGNLLGLVSERAPAS